MKLRRMKFRRTKKCASFGPPSIYCIFIWKFVFSMLLVHLGASWDALKCLVWVHIYSTQTVSPLFYKKILLSLVNNQHLAKLLTT